MTKTLSPHAIAAKALRAELKAAFPDAKLSVRARTASMMSAIDVEWINGPTTAAVKAVADKYQYGHFDGMTDGYYMSNNRADLPAQVKYVQVHRKIADETRALVEKGLEELHCEPDGAFRRSEVIWKIFGKTDMTKGVLGVRRTNVTCGSYEDFFEIVTPDSPAETEPRCQRCSEIVGADGFCQRCADYDREQAEAKARCEAHRVAEQAAHALLDGVVLSEVSGLRLTARWAKLNKNDTLDQYKQECARGDYVEVPVEITHRADLTHEQFRAFGGHLLSDFPWLDGLGGTDSDYPFEGSDVEWRKLPKEQQDAWRAKSYRLGVLVTRPDGYAIVVDPQGYKYARYVGLLTTPVAQEA